MSDNNDPYCPSIPAPTFTQIPNVVLDYWMPRLTLPELAVLVFICRKTFGWHKTEDKISRSQLAKGTGLSRPTLKVAIDGLVAYGLVNRTEVNSGSGCESNLYSLIVSNISDPGKGFTTPPGKSLTTQKKPFQKKGTAVDVVSHEPKPEAERCPTCSNRESVAKPVQRPKPRGLRRSSQFSLRNGREVPRWLVRVGLSERDNRDLMNQFDEASLEPAVARHLELEHQGKRAYNPKGRIADFAKNPGHMSKTRKEAVEEKRSARAELEDGERAQAERALRMSRLVSDFLERSLRGKRISVLCCELCVIVTKEDRKIFEVDYKNIASIPKIVSDFSELGIEIDSSGLEKIMNGGFTNE